MRVYVDTVVHACPSRCHTCPKKDEWLEIRKDAYAHDLMEDRTIKSKMATCL